MLFRRKKRTVKYSDLRSRLNDYSTQKEKTRWSPAEIEEDYAGSLFTLFPLSCFREMHSYLLFKITLALLAVFMVFLFSLVKIPFTDSVLEKIQYITTWKMDFLAIGRETIPVIRGLWEGDLESNLERAVLAPAGSALVDARPDFIAPLEGELEETYGLKFNHLLQREEMFYGLVFSAPQGTDVKASAAGRVKEIKEHPYYGLVLVLEHPGQMETCYGYLSTVLVREGEEVRQGQDLAKVGLSPLEKKASLYFEVRDQGNPLDPLPLLLD